MYQSLQQSLLPFPTTHKTFALVLLLSSLLACSKKETIMIPGKPITISREFNFSIAPGTAFDEEDAKQVSVKLKLSVSKFNTGSNSRDLLWDTVISKDNLYQFTHNGQEVINTRLEGTTDHFRNLLFSYLIIYNNRGTLVTRSGASALREDDQKELEVRL